jgi:hypothetical protein
MKFTITLVLLFVFSTAFCQWTRVEELPAKDIASLYHKDSTFYAGGKKIIYVSHNMGKSWDSIVVVPQLTLVTSIIVYKNELYAAAPHNGIFKSADEGQTWQDISAGLFPDVADLCEFRGDLYAATFGNSVYKLNPANGNSWLLFSNGLSNLSANLPSIAANSNAIIAGTLANGIYDYLPANSTNWQERLLAGQIDPSEGAYDIVTAHDTLFYSGRTGKFYMSLDNGLNWNFIGDRLASLATTMVNAKEALIVSRRVLEAGFLKIRFYFIKKNALQSPFVNFSVQLNHFTYKMDIVGNKLWDASDKGLFFMPLSALPGITAVEDTIPVVLPVRFISFTANCNEGKVSLNWKTAQEQNSSHFTVERSSDNFIWTAISDVPAAGNSSVEKTYAFTDNDPLQNIFYRIAQYDFDGRVEYTNALRSSCSFKDGFSVWPNPVPNKLSIHLVTVNPSEALIKLFDSKGSLVKQQKATLLQGSNQLSIDMSSLPKAMYTLTIAYNGGRDKKTVQLIKQ